MISDLNPQAHTKVHTFTTSSTPVVAPSSSRQTKCLLLLHCRCFQRCSPNHWDCGDARLIPGERWTTGIINDGAGYSGGPGNEKPSLQKRYWEASRATQLGLRWDDSHELCLSTILRTSKSSQQTGQHNFETETISLAKFWEDMNEKFYT